MEVHIRDIDPEVWKAMRLEAMRQGISMGRLVESLWKARAKQAS